MISSSTKIRQRRGWTRLRVFLSILALLVGCTVASDRSGGTEDTLCITKERLSQALLQTRVTKEQNNADLVWDFILKEKHLGSQYSTSAHQDDVVTHSFRITSFIKDRSTREAITEISKLISMANILYVIGSLLLIEVFFFVVYTLKGGTTKTVALVTLQAIFYNIGIMLLEQPHSELIGGLVYTMPAWATPVVLLSLLSDAGLVRMQDVNQMLCDLTTAGPRIERNHSHLYELSIFLELATMLVACWLYGRNAFPGLFAPIFFSAYLVLVSLVLRFQGAPFQSFPSRLLYKDFYLSFWSVAFAALLFWAGASASFDVLLPDWIVLSLTAEVRFACLVTACNVGVVAVPVALLSLSGVSRRDGDGKWEISLPSLPLPSKARFLLLMYVVSNLVLMCFSLKAESLVLAPYGLAGIVFANGLVWFRNGSDRFYSFCLLGLAVGISLIVISSGYNNVVDGQVMQLLAWLGKPTAFNWVVVLLIRGMTTLSGVVVLLACWDRITHATSPSLLDHFWDSPVLCGVVTVLDWFGYVLLCFVSDEHEVFGVLKLALNFGATFILMHGARFLSVALIILAGHQGHQQEQALPKNFLEPFPSTMFLLGVRAAIFAGDSVLRNAACLLLMSGVMLRISRNPSFEYLFSASVLSFFGTSTALLVGSKLYTTIGLVSIYAIIGMLALRETNNKAVLAGVVAAMAITTISVGMAFDTYSALAQALLPEWLASALQGYKNTDGGKFAERVALEFVFDKLGLPSFYISSSIAQDQRNYLQGTLFDNCRRG